jgi:hypothetical protein
MSDRGSDLWGVRVQVRQETREREGMWEVEPQSEKLQRAKERERERKRERERERTGKSRKAHNVCTLGKTPTGALGALRRGGRIWCRKGARPRGTPRPTTAWRSRSGLCTTRLAVQKAPMLPCKLGGTGNAVSSLLPLERT